MNKNIFQPLAMFVVILVAGYIMYGGLSSGTVDYAAYQKTCDEYRTAQPGTYKKDQLQMLVYKVNYLLPDQPADIADPVQKKLKQCAVELDALVSQTVEAK